MIRLQELSPFKFIEINGMKLTEPNQAFPMLWEFISGQKATARHSLSLLESHFKTPSPGRETWYDRPYFLIGGSLIHQ